LVCPDFLDQLDVMAYLESEDCLVPLDPRATLEKTASREKLVCPAPRDTRGVRETWDRLAVLVQGASAEKSGPLDPLERRVHRASWDRGDQRARMELLV